MKKGPRKNRRGEIVTATIRLVARQGMRAATIRQIAQASGVTEGAIYRHFSSKEDLCHQAYCQIVAEMAAAKEQLVASQRPLRDKLREWIQVSYAYFDHYPEAFTYVLLTPHAFTEDPEGITSQQGQLLMHLIRQVSRQGQMPPVQPVMALCFFTGMMLNIPRLINEGALKGPASRYTDEVAEAVWRVFKLT